MLCLSCGVSVRVHVSSNHSLRFKGCEAALQMEDSVFFDLEVGIFRLISVWVLPFYSEIKRSGVRVGVEGEA